jgi:hypothetical protein
MIEFREINKNNINQIIPKIINIQEKRKKELNNLWKWNKLFFTNTKDEFLKYISENKNKFI